MTEKGHTGRQIPIEFHIPETVAGRYATNLQVVHTEHEFILSFYEVMVPAFPTEMTDADEALSQIETVRAECVARVTVAAARMPSFVKVLQQNLEHYKSLPKDSE